MCDLCAGGSSCFFQQEVMKQKKSPTCERDVWGKCVCMWCVLLQKVMVTMQLGGGGGEIMDIMAPSGLQVNLCGVCSVCVYCRGGELKKRELWNKETAQAEGKVSR